jgi:site-specific DNA-cytosine methylase
MLRSVDLFTGIGGLTHALRGIATPVTYCESEPTRVATLTTLMRKGLLPEAPIHTDVRTFTAADLDDPSSIDMVMGGWPCRGWSVVGKRQGFDHEQSALFFEFARIVNEIKPRFVFQENVPAVAGEAPLTAIAAALSDYDLVWMTLPAFAVGAPQVRLRWYCLGIRRDVATARLDISTPCIRHAFLPEPVPRMSGTQRPTARLSMLGNSVVPDAVRLAFLMLWSGFTKGAAELWTATSLDVTRPRRQKRLGTTTRSEARRYGSCIDGAWWRHDLPPETVPPPPNYGLELVPFAIPAPATTKAPDDNIAHAPVLRRMWASPRGANLGSSVVLTRRNCRDLYTQLRFERRTPDALRPGYTNPEWVEHLMGYPRGWTEME